MLELHETRKSDDPRDLSRDSLLSIKPKYNTGVLNIASTILLIIILLIYNVFEFDTNKNEFLNSSLDYFNTNCVKPYNHVNNSYIGIISSPQCNEKFCNIQMCGLVYNQSTLYSYGVTNITYVDDTYQYYYYDSSTSYIIRVLIFSSFILYFIVTIYLNKVSDEIKTRNEITFMSKASVIMFPVFTCLISVTTGNLYLRGDSVYKMILMSMLISLLTIRVSIKSLKNVHSLDIYMNNFRSYRMSKAYKQAEVLKIRREFRTKDQIIENMTISMDFLESLSNRLYYKLAFETIYTIYFSLILALETHSARGQYLRYTTILAGFSTIQLLFLSVLQITYFNDEILLIENDNKITTRLKVNLLGLEPKTAMLASVSFTILCSVSKSAISNVSLCDQY